MKNILLLSLVLLLSACASPGVVPSDASVQAIKRIRVIAMESRPIRAAGSRTVVSAAGLDSSKPSSRGPGTVPFPPVPNPTTGSAIGGVFTIIQAGAYLSSEHPEADQRSQRISDAAMEILNRDGPWVPARVLAVEAERQLTAGGWSTALSPMLQPIPGYENRAVKDLDWNWAASINRWYNADVSEYDYAAHSAAATDTVLEVLVAVNEVVSISTANLFHLGVMVKLVDPSTRKVFGKVSNGEFIKLSEPEMDQLFSDGGKAYKELFTTTSRKFVRQCLARLHLESRRP